MEADLLSPTSKRHSCVVFVLELCRGRVIPHSYFEVGGISMLAIDLGLLHHCGRVSKVLMGRPGQVSRPVVELDHPFSLASIPLSSKFFGIIGSLMT